MPASFKILTEMNIVLVRFEGDITVDQNVDCLGAYREDPQFDGGQHILLDVANCTFPERFFEETQRLADRLTAFHTARDPRARTSIYAPGKVNFGICKLYRDTVRARMPYPLEVSRTAEDALRYAELDPRDPAARRLLHVPTIGRAAF
ncbi:hypothetical protein GGQ68_000414 [Sagittula marina]|uniref:Uncharacterized protein n=1 Tax=Sagittula marina TaxID=943940 RepID=A0A7W6DQE3_9RHOB|nr:hypothetical protein [Sagittula marina]MBB3984103.1 hypothetical protein [Sagittula marina]